MKIINLIESFIKRALLCFAMIVVSFSAIVSLIDVQFLAKGVGISQVFGFLLFSLMLSLSFEISKLFRTNSVLKGAVKFILTLASFIVAFFLNGSFSEYLSQKQNPAFSVIVLSFTFVIIYVVCGMIWLAYSSFKNRLSNSTKEYENVYNDKK